MKDEDRYTSLEQSKILEPIMDKFSLPYEGFWVGEEFYDHERVNNELDTFSWYLEDFLADCKENNIEVVKVYRLDTLLWVLPEISCHVQYHGMNGYPDNVLYYFDDGGYEEDFLNRRRYLFCLKHHRNKPFQLSELIQDLLFNKGAQAIAAATELIKLLDDNDLLEANN